MANLRTAVFDPAAFYPFRALIEERLTDLHILPAIERFVRGIVLHDEMVMEIEPHPSNPEEEQEVDTVGPRYVITGYGPTLEGYEKVLSSELGPRPEPTHPLTPALLQVAEDVSGAGPGDPYYKAHVGFLRRIASVLETGGSALCDGYLWNSALVPAQRFPTLLFDSLDHDWQRYVQELNDGQIGIVIPPILSIILTRCARRSSILDIVRDLRDEWATPRAKMWALIDALKTAGTVEEATRISRELEDAATLFSIVKEPRGSRPLRVLWDVFATAAIPAGVVGAMSDSISGAAKAAAVAGTLAATKAAIEKRREFGRVLFSQGAFDLAKRIQKETSQADMPVKLLSRLLTASERTKLGL